MYPKAEKDLVLTQWYKINPLHKKTTAQYKNELFSEYLKLMVIQANNPSPGTISNCPSTQIDEIWHSHFICTREYAAFCARIGKGTFIHHAPSDGLKSYRENYMNTIQRYNELGFGDITQHADCWEGPQSKSGKINTMETTDSSEEDEDEDEESADVAVATAAASAAAAAAAAASAAASAAAAVARKQSGRKSSNNSEQQKKKVKVATNSLLKYEHEANAITTITKQLPPGDPSRPARHLRAFMNLVQDGIAHATRRYSACY